MCVCVGFIDAYLPAELFALTVMPDSILCICVLESVSASVRACMHIVVKNCQRLCACTFPFVCAYVCLCVCVYVCVCACACACSCVRDMCIDL